MKWIGSLVGYSREKKFLWNIVYTATHYITGCIRACSSFVGSSYSQTLSLETVNEASVTMIIAFLEVRWSTIRSINERKPLKSNFTKTKPNICDIPKQQRRKQFLLSLRREKYIMTSSKKQICSSSLNLNAQSKRTVHWI